MNSSRDSAVIRAQRLARQLIHVLHLYVALLDELHTISTSTWTRIPEVFFSSFSRRMEKCAQSMLQVCTSCTWLAGCMMKGGEWGQCTGTGPFE